MKGLALGYGVLTPSTHPEILRRFLSVCDNILKIVRIAIVRMLWQATYVVNKFHFVQVCSRSVECV